MARPENEPATPLAKRLRQVRAVLGNPERKKFADQLGISRNSLASYERGENEPAASVITSYIVCFDVSPLWLLLGEGDMFSRHQTNVNDDARLDRDAMTKAIEAVEEGLAGHSFSLKRKAELVLACYDLIIADQSDETMAKIIKLVKAAA